MKISIITVCFNSDATIRDTIHAVASQRNVELEHIIVDGGSNDKTVDFIQQHSNQICKWISECDQGIYDAMNKGIKMASGDIIGFLNADDVYTNDHVLEKVLLSFSDSSVDACYSDLVYVEQNDIGKVVRYWKACEYKEGLYLNGWCPPHPTFFVRRSVYEKYGEFDLNYKLAADFELMARFIVKFKIKTKYIPATLVKMRLGGETNKSIFNILVQNYEILQAYRKNNIDFSPIKFIVGKVFSRGNQYFTKRNYKPSQNT